jgi:hypothetical protein
MRLQQILPDSLHFGTVKKLAAIYVVTVSNLLSQLRRGPKCRC